MATQALFADRLARRSQVLSLWVIVSTLGAVSWGQQGQPFLQRRIPRAPREMLIQLPQPVTDGNVSLEKALREQQQAALPSDQRLSFAEIGQLAWAGQGVWVPQMATGAVMPRGPLGLKMYFVLPDGVYQYNPVGHSLVQIADGDQRLTMAASAPNRPGAAVGGAQIVLAASQRDYAVQYGPRARTAMLLAAGQAAESLQLEASSLGLAFVSVDNINPNTARRVIRLSRVMEPLYTIFVGYPAGQTPAATTTLIPVSQPVPKTALLVVPPQGFQDQELLETKRVLEYVGVTTVIASTHLGPLQGFLGGTVDATLLINQANVADYGAVVFIGGPGIADYVNNPTALNLARQALAQRRVVAALGTAPAILASAGVLRGVTATGFLSEQARIVQGGAKYTGNPVQKDGLIVTGTGAAAAPLFAQTVAEAIGEAG
jgi:protease I